MSNLMARLRLDKVSKPKVSMLYMLLQVQKTGENYGNVTRMVRYSFDIQSSIHSQVALPADHVTCLTMADFDDPADLPEEFHVRR